MNARERMLLRRMAQTSNGLYWDGYGLVPGATKRERRRLVRAGYIEIVGRGKMHATRGHNIVRLTPKGRRAAYLLDRRAKRLPEIREPSRLSWWSDMHRNRHEIERV